MNYKAGQLANRLFYFSHFISNSIEYNYKLINPSFDEYNKFFTSTSINEFGNLDISISLTNNTTIDTLIRKSINVLHKVAFPPLKNAFGYRFHDIKEYDDRSDLEKYNDRSICFDMNDADFVESAKNKVVFIDGWLYRDFKNFSKHSPALREIFTPLPEYMDQVQEIINKCKTLGDTIVGVHLRRGDFKDFNNGKWYYEDETYYKKMLEVEQELAAKGRRCVFLMCSNEKINKNNFKGLPIVNESRHYIVDLYVLSQCDYLIGPPSTYSMWASFYGEVPLYHINDPKKQITLSDFEVITQG
ncbi:alpha-1,2-fucosyltransferase [Pontibacter sp. KCTC 32443]|uniref:alpha-1,2-fucosyltransferase n=1 Tax=Pontibacter TaxID=323449 RepID=UPI00164D4F25|nr:MULTISPECIES: alpha-1,2-fucosyltransferase [Pontibacter]MBC5772974.1 alpha-1,2-fucosyltransferase [Pontibacter sp. KCTC 32443]